MVKCSEGDGRKKKGPSKQERKRVGSEKTKKHQWKEGTGAKAEKGRQ